MTLDVKLHTNKLIIQNKKGLLINKIFNKIQTEKSLNNRLMTKLIKNNLKIKMMHKYQGIKVNKIMRKKMKIYSDNKMIYKLKTKFQWVRKQLGGLEICSQCVDLTLVVLQKTHNMTQKPGKI